MDFIIDVSPADAPSDLFIAGIDGEAIRGRLNTTRIGRSYGVQPRADRVQAPS
jgi:hypothetical protein